MTDSNLPTLPTIITTEQPQEEAASTSAQQPSPPATSTSTSRPDLNISTATNETNSASNDHGRNYSISSIPPKDNRGHSKNNSSLGSAIGMLQVPGSTSGGALSSEESTTEDQSYSNSSSPTATHHAPTSPTMSVLSDSSSTNHNQKSTLALRNHDNTHARKVSNAHSDVSAISEIGEGEGEKDATQGSTSKDAKTISHPVTTTLNSTKKESNNQESENIPDLENISLWQKIKLLRPGAMDRHEAAKMQAAREKAKLADPSPFQHRPHELGNLVDPKSVETLRDMGGIEGLLKELGTNKNGLNVPINGVEPEKKDIENDAGGEGGFANEDRKRVYGSNTLPPAKSKSLLMLMWLALQDKILILLCFFAVISLALGFYTDFGTEPATVPCANPPPGREGCDAAQIDWVEGVAILIAVAIVAGVGSVNDYQKEAQFRKLNDKKEERDVKVRRYGQEMTMSVYEVMVGDVLLLEAGEILPADGVFLKGGSVKCDESGATGESDMVRKCTYDEALKDLERQERDSSWKKPNRDPFLISGSRVLEGVGEYVVIAIGPNSFNGRLLLSLRVPPEITPLQAKLNRLAGLIAKLGSAAGLLLFTALMIRFFVQLKTVPGRDANDKAQDFIDILIIAVTLVVVAVPEGLPLAVTVALAFATKRMTNENLLVRLLGSCETMANASVICTDKTGTLTQNEMSVVAGSVGAHCKFAYRITENSGRIDTQEPAPTTSTGANGKDFAIDQHSLSDVIKGPLRELFNDAIAVNSTAFEEYKDGSQAEAAGTGLLARAKRALFGSGKKTGGSPVTGRKAAIAEATAAASVSFVGSKTETALLKLAKELKWDDYRAARERAEVVQLIPFSSERKAMGVVVKLPNGKYRLHVKGASEVLSKLCEKLVVVPAPSESTDGEIKTEDFTEDTRDNIAKTIIFYANQSLRTIAICYRDFESWPPKGVDVVSKKGDDEINVSGVDATVEVPYEVIAQDLTLLAITGIEDPLRPGVREAVATCGKAGVAVKMCTGDNVLTARSIATQCGIYTPGGIIMEGPTFRQLSPQDRAEILPRLQVLARSSPEDKKILVEGLKALGEVVGVTGDGTNDGPALKTANVGFAMGIAGTEVAKEASDIILMDDNFASIVSAIMWGRCVNDAVKKFLQFQLSVNIVAVIVTFVTAVASAEEQSALTAVQLLWLNLIMDTMAALALATDPASPSLLDRKPDRRSAPLISTDMWKMIIGQSIYQTILVMVLHFKGHDILGLGSMDPVIARRQETELSALVFNTFVFCQLFNQVNCRRLDRKYNIFEGIHRNIWFFLIICVEIGAQVLIMYVGGAAFSVTRLEGRDWGIAIVAGIISWPLGAFIRTIPTQPIENLLIRFNLMPDPNAPSKFTQDGDDDMYSKEKQLEKEEAAKDWNEPALGEVASRLALFSRIRGGRSRDLFKTRSQRMRDGDVHPQTLMALVPSLIGASIGSSWHPSNAPEATIQDPAAGDPTVSSVALFQGQQMQLHPETQENDEFKQRLSQAAERN